MFKDKNPNCTFSKVQWHTNCPLHLYITVRQRRAESVESKLTSNIVLPEYLYYFETLSFKFPFDIISTNTLLKEKYFHLLIALINNFWRGVGVLSPWRGCCVSAWEWEVSGLTAAGQINHDESQVTKCYNAARDQARPASHRRWNNKSNQKVGTECVLY